jgi:hypothetical protein
VIVELGPTEVDDVSGAIVAAGGVVDVLGATLGAVKPADGREVMLDIDNEVMLSAEVKEDMKTDCWETRSLIELKKPASAEGLKGTSVIGDLQMC